MTCYRIPRQLLWIPGGDTTVMSEAIKLFGRRITVPESQAAAEFAEGCDLGPALMHDEVEKDPCQEAIVAEVTELSSEDIEELDCNDQDGVSGSNGAKDANEKEITVDGKLMCDSKPEEEQAGKVSGQEKILKKPDKILPCPRCNSMDTKFCYFNNYNVNQPRHFCKNCQRYWTAGGTMRNVPVGAGRRKNKHSSSHYRHLITVSEGMPPLRIDVPDSPHCQSSNHLNGTRTLLKFGQEVQICDSITSSLNIREQTRKCDDPTACSEIGKEPTCSSSLEISTSLGKESLADAGQVNQNIISDPSSRSVPMHSLPCYPGPHWAFPWSPGWNDIAAAAAAAEAGRSFSAALNGEESSIPVPWSLSPVMSAPAFVGSTIPVPLVPASFWGCMASWPPAAWNIPFMGLSGCQSLSSFNDTNACSTIHSPRLGKHSRDAIPQGEERVEKSLWVPKTLRMDDPEEAAKSSIWATLGIKPDRNEPFFKGGIFKSFQPQAAEKPLPPDATHVMQANPAALCRSRTFQETI